MRIAVITPYYKEPLEVLRKCHDSVRNQTYRGITHMILSEGFPHDEVDSWDAMHFRLPKAHGDAGDTPRLMGSASAAALGFDAIAYLDADNTFEPEHIETLTKAHFATGADVITSARTMVRMDGSPMKICRESDGVNFCDTNCYLIMRHAFDAAAAWGLKDRSLSVVGDRLFWKAIKSKYRTCHSMRPTVNYTAQWAVYYEYNGETPPADSRVNIRTPQGVSTVTFAEYSAMEGVERVNLVDEAGDLK